MNAVTPHVHRPAATATRVTPQLEAALRDAEAPHPDIGRNAALVTAPVRAEARRLLRETEILLQAVASERDWARWLLPLATLPKAPEARHWDIAARSVAFALDDVPRCLLTVVRQRQALRSLKWWPTPAELSALFAGDLNTLRRRARCLRALVETPPPQASSPAASPLQREAMAQRLRGLAAELRGAEAAQASATPKPRHMDGERLAAWRERQRQQSQRFR